MSTHRQVAKSAGIIGGLTALSRVLGFVRDIVIAAAFGTGAAAEAFVVSFKIPNLLRDLVGEGATNAAFVPVLTETKEKRPKEFWPLVSTLFFMMAGILTVLTLLGILFTPQIVKLLAPGFAEAGDPKFPLTVQLTRVIFPYLILIGLSALAMGVLNALKEFKTSALGPALLNLCMIIAGVFFEKTYGPMALVVGVLAGGVLQLAWQLPPLVKSGFRLTKPSWKHSSAGKIGKLLIPRAFGSAIYQVNVFIDSILASFEHIVGPGGQSALYYSNRLFQLPLAIFGIALAQAVLPTFSTQMVKRDIEAFKETLLMASRALLFFVLPAAMGLIVLAGPIVRIIFERGEFNAYSTQITSSALFFYAFGLVSCVFVKIFVNAFYAMQDTRTPVKTMAFCVALNVGLSLVFMRILGVGGLALSASISATVNVALLYVALRKKLGNLHEEKILPAAVRMLTAASLMALVAVALDRFLLSPGITAPRLVQMIGLFIVIAVSIGVYFSACLAFKIEEAGKLLRWRG